MTDLEHAMREAILRMEWACEQLAATRSLETYDAMIRSGQAQELLELDNARRAAREVLQNAECSSQDGRGPVRALSAQDALTPLLHEVRAVLEPFAKAAESVVSDSRGAWNPDEWGKRVRALNVGEFRKLAALYARLPLPAEKGKRDE